MTQTIINVKTGKPPTSEEMEAIKQRALEIYANPYASPEQLDWAANAYPEGFAEVLIYPANIKHVII